LYIFYTHSLSKEYFNIMSYSDSSALWTKNRTVLGISNANRCRTSSVLPYEKHLSTRAKANFCSWCSVRVSMISGAGVVVGGHPVSLL